MICLRGLLLLLIGVSLDTWMFRMYAFTLDDLQFSWEKNGDVFIVNDSQLVLNCTYTNASVPRENVSQLIISKESVNVSAIYLHTYFEDRTLQLRIPHAHINDSGIYICWDGVNHPKLKSVNIGVEPPLPEKIICISQNFQNLECSFRKPSKSDIPMSWTMEFSYDDKDWSQVNKANCKIESENYTCFWPPTDSPNHEEAFMRLMNKYYIQVILQNRIGNNSAKIEFHPKDIVRPNVVDNLIVTLKNSSRQVILSWSFPHDLPSTIELIYHLTLCNQWGEEKVQYINNTNLQTDLIPYTKYSFEVKCKPVNADGEVYWSTPAILNFSTNPDFPDKGPIVTEGAFVQLNCRTNYICMVYIYWQNPPAWQINGALVGYKIVIASDMKSKIIKNESLCNMPCETQKEENKGGHCTERNGEHTSAEVPVNFTNHTNVVACIALRNTVGLSKPSLIVIPALQQAPKPDLVIVEEGERNFQVSWMRDNRDLGVTTVTYFWCIRNRLIVNTTLLCGGTLGTHSVQNTTSSDWKSFTLNRNNVSIQTTNQSSLYFAVALLQNEISGGMVWQGCKFLKGKAPNKPAYQVKPLETNSTLLQIEVPRVLLCQADNGGRPETYVVSYKQVADDYKKDECPQDGFNNKTFEAQLEKEIQYYILSGLIEGGKYIMCLGSSNRDSQMIQYGPSLFVETTRQGVSKGENITIIYIIIVPVVVIVLISVLVYVCFDRLKRCIKRPTIIVPDVHHFKIEEVHGRLDENYIELDDQKNIGPKSSKINNKDIGLDADSGTGSVESTCSGDDIKETKYVDLGRSDSGTSSGRSDSYRRLVETTSSMNLSKTHEQHLIHKRTESDCLIKFAMDMITDSTSIASQNCHQVFPVTAASSSARNSSVESYVVAALKEGKNSSEYLLDTNHDSLKSALKETRKLSIISPFTLKSLAAVQVKLNNNGKEQSMAQKMTDQVPQVPNDGSYVQATLEDKEMKTDVEEVEVVQLEEQEGMDTSWEENMSSKHHHESSDDALIDQTIEYLLDSGSTPVVGYVKPIEANLASGAFCVSDAASYLSESLIPIDIRPFEVTVAKNHYLSGDALSCDEDTNIDKIPWSFESGEPQEFSKSQGQSFKNNTASYIKETPGISDSKSHSRGELVLSALQEMKGF